MRCWQGRMKIETDPHRMFVEDLTGDTAEQGCTGGVGAGRTDHHRAHDVETRDGSGMSNGHGGTQLNCRTLQTPNIGRAMGEKPVILVVDDDGPILALMRNLLKEFGFQAVTAATGLEAIDVARQQQPALVLLDKNMPGMPGDQVIRTLRGEPGFDNLPILILTGERLTRADLAE